jgi:hypothetical protein
MLLEQITSDGEQDESQQPDVDQNPKKGGKLKTMKKVVIVEKISPSARRSAIMNRNMDERNKKSILRAVYDKVTGNED